MKSKELIRLLQEEDPTGEVEVCVGNVDIYFLSSEPSFWDGYLQVLSRDESKKPYYNLTGGKYVSRGKKIVIHPVTISEVLRSNPDTAIVDYSEVTPTWIDRMKTHDEKVRQASRDSERKLDIDNFIGWAKKKAGALHPNFDPDEVREVAESFYDENLSPNDPLKVLPAKKDRDGNSWMPSVIERRESYWDDIAKLTFDGWWGIQKIEGQTTEA